MGYSTWAKEVMSLQRFKQMQAALHPKSEYSINGDKCHQLHYAINKLNDSAQNTFIPGIDMYFYECGALLHSRMNPVHKDKPKKFRVDFLY